MGRRPTSDLPPGRRPLWAGSRRLSSSLPLGPCPLALSSQNLHHLLIDNPDIKALFSHPPAFPAPFFRQLRLLDKTLHGPGQTIWIFDRHQKSVFSLPNSPTALFLIPFTDVRPPTSDVSCSKSRRPTSDIRHPASDVSPSPLLLAGLHTSRLTHSG